MVMDGIIWGLFKKGKKKQMVVEKENPSEETEELWSLSFETVEITG